MRLKQHHYASVGSTDARRAERCFDLGRVMTVIVDYQSHRLLRL